MRMLSSKVMNIHYFSLRCCFCLLKTKLNVKHYCHALYKATGLATAYFLHFLEDVVS